MTELQSPYSLGTPFKWKDIDYSAHKRRIVITEHVKFAEDKSEYKWIYREVAQTFRSNEIWSDDEDSTTEDIKDTCKSKSDEEVIDIIQLPDDADKKMKSIPEDMETVRARSVEGKRKRDRPKKKVCNPYGRKGKPKEAQTMKRKVEWTERQKLS